MVPAFVDVRFGPAAFAAAATAPPQRAEALSTPSLSLPADLLDGGEVILFAIKPSPWFVLLEPLKWIAAAPLVLALMPHVCPPSMLGLSQFVWIQFILLGLGARMLVTLMRWGSRFYVLTNRRVMTVRGVRRPAVWSCPLVHVRNTRLSATADEQLARLGTIEFVPDQDPPDVRRWTHVAHPADVHAEIRKAISRALD
jgi:hypothetical protein